MNFTKEQLNTILKNKPLGTTNEQILSELVSKGAVFEGADMTKVKQIASNYQQSKVVEAEKESGVAGVKDLAGDAKDAFLGVGERLFEAGEGIVEDATNEDLTLGEKARGIGSKAFKGASRAFGEVVFGAGKALLTQDAEDAIAKKAQEVGLSVAESDFAQDLIGKYQALPDDAKREVDNALGFAEGLADIITLGTAKSVSTPLKKAAMETIDTVGEGLTKAGNDVFRVGKQTVEKGKDLATRSKNAITGTKEVPIVETISPQITARESRRIAEQGRVVQPKKSIIFGKQPDIVTPEESVQKAASIIETKIKNANKLDQYQLGNELKKLNTTTAKELKPQLQTVKVKPEITDNALKTWDDLKAKQADQPEFLDFGGSKKFQERFERYLTEIKNRVKGPDGKFREKDLNDIWEIRKEYDDSMSKAVREATAESAPSTQLQHDMWIQNRNILNDIIFDMSQDLDDAVRGSFEEMSLLYNARNNLIQKAKIDVKGEKGLFSEENLVKAFIGLAGANILLGD